MKKRVLTLMFAAAVLTAAAGVGLLPTSARAQEAACSPGLTLVTGGVPEADLNGDGLTCEAQSVDVATAIWTTIATDNNQPEEPPPGKIACPDGFVGQKGLCCKTVPPGAKLGRLICIPPPPGLNPGLK